MTREDYALIAFGVFAFSVLGIYLIIRSAERDAKHLKVFRTNKPFDEYHIGQN